MQEGSKEHVAPPTGAPPGAQVSVNQEDAHGIRKEPLGAASQEHDGAQRTAEEQIKHNGMFASFYFFLIHPSQALINFVFKKIREVLTSADKKLSYMYVCISKTMILFFDCFRLLYFILY